MVEFILEPAIPAHPPAIPSVEPPDNPPGFQFYENDSNLIGGGTVINDANKIEFGYAPVGIVDLPEDAGKRPVHLWNDKGGILGSGSATGIKIYIVSSDGDLEHPAFLGTVRNDFKSIIEARSVGGVNVPGDSQSTWTPISPWDFLTIGNMPRNSMRTIEVRINPPLDMLEITLTDFFLRVTYDV